MSDITNVIRYDTHHFITYNGFSTNATAASSAEASIAVLTLSTKHNVIQKDNSK